ncbi:hypothetical protein C8R47DRAFT_1244389 [Mycena vitilis]|nr:hypothetical protein C8R47DRAFT_1244389 [Mycena vitilis]
MHFSAFVLASLGFLAVASAAPADVKHDGGVAPYGNVSIVPASIGLAKPTSYKYLLLGTTSYDPGESGVVIMVFRDLDKPSKSPKKLISIKRGPLRPEDLCLSAGLATPQANEISTMASGINYLGE